MSACVAVIDPAVSSPATAAFNEMVRLSALPLTYHMPFLYGMGSLRALALDNIAGALVLGSNSSVNLPCAHHSEFTAWVRDFCQQQRKPLLGICYGHQLVAWLFGSKVAFMHPDCKKISGLRSVEVMSDKRLGITARQQEIVVSHNEVVTTIPDCLEVFAHSKDIPYDGLRHRDLPIWSIQAHVEATQDFLDSQGIVMTLPTRVKSQGFAIVAAFLAYCNKVPATSAAIGTRPDGL